jgi:hypothetical protein
MYTYDELVNMYKALGESQKMAERHARQAMELQKPEALLESYAQGSKIKARATAKAYNNLR